MKKFLLVSLLFYLKMLIKYIISVYNIHEEENVC